MNQNTIDFMYGLRDLLKKHNVELESREVSRNYATWADGIDVNAGSDVIELPKFTDWKDIQDWLDTPEGSE